jgi:hypothetical protein
MASRGSVPSWFEGITGYPNDLFLFDIDYTLAGLVLLICRLREIGFHSVILRRVATDTCESVFSMLRARAPGSLDVACLRDAFRTISMSVHTRSGSYEVLDQGGTPDVHTDLKVRAGDEDSHRRNTGVWGF